MANTDSFGFDDLLVDGPSQETRLVKTGTATVDMYKHHSVVHVDDSKDAIILAIGYNPQVADNNTETESTSDNESQSPSNDTKLEATRKNGIDRFADPENDKPHDEDDKKNGIQGTHFKPIEVGTYIQTDLYAKATHNATDLKDNKSSVDLALLENILTSDSKTRPTGILIAWGAKGKQDLIDNPEYREKLIRLLIESGINIYYFSDEKDPHTCHAASYTNKKGSLRCLGSKPDASVLEYFFE